MKKNGNLGYCKLTFAIIIVGIIIFLGVRYIIKEIHDEQVKDFQSDMLLVQSKVELIKGNYSMDKENNTLKGYQLSQLPEWVDINEFFEKNIISEEDYEKFYLLNNEILEECGLSELINRYDGYFIVNYDDYEVVYSKGYVNENGLWSFKISEMNKVIDLEKQETVETVAEPEGSEETDNKEENIESNENPSKSSELGDNKTSNEESDEINQKDNEVITNKTNPNYKKVEDDLSYALSEYRKNVASEKVIEE